MRLSFVVLLLCLGVRPVAAKELEPKDLGWPKTTQSAKTKKVTTVYPKAKKKGDHLGKITKGTRLAWKRIVKTKDKCKAWLEIEPRGWVCAKDVKPSDEAPAATEVEQKHTDPDWAGIDLAASPPASWPWAWALEPQPWTRKERKGKAPPPPKPTNVYAKASKDAEVVRTVEPRAVVSVLETDGDFVRIGKGEWMAREDLRIADKHARPDGVGKSERWIDVDLDEQVLIAYDGDTPVYATLVTTGRRNGTPTGIYRVASKIAKKTIASGEGRKGSWYHPDVPFTVYFRHRYMLHGAYWHDRFGNMASHGCVNLSPADAGWIYGFVEPVAPAGWLEVRTQDGEDGTAVRIHSDKDPDPAWTDYRGKRVTRKPR
jgi:hypothetical protein